MRGKTKLGSLGAAIISLTLLNSCGAELGPKKAITQNNPFFRIMEFNIINGTEVEEGAYPFMISLQSDFFGGHLCGASLISSQYVLTAGHCTPYISPSSSQVVIGLHNQTDMSAADVLEIAEVIEHPDYDGDVNNDFALIKLKNPVDINVYPPVRLNRDEINIPVDGSNDPIVATVMGWGTTEEGDLSDVLMEVDVPLVTFDTCMEAYPNDLTDSMICAGYKEGGKDSCQGDSGGPLILKGNNDEPLLIGTVSWGEGCAAEGKYGVYGKVSKAVDWIDSVISSQP